jgi:hypothetical protein
MTKLKKLKENQDKEMMNMIQVNVNRQLELENGRKLKIREKEREFKIKFTKFSQKFLGLSKEINILLSADENDREEIFDKLAKKNQKYELRKSEEYKQSVKNFFEYRRLQSQEQQKELEIKENNHKILMKKRSSLNLDSVNAKRDYMKKKILEVAKNNQDMIELKRPVNITKIKIF